MPRTPGRKKPTIKNEASFAKRKRGSGAYHVCVARMNASGLAPGSLLTKALGPRRPASRRSGECEAPIFAPWFSACTRLLRSEVESPRGTTLAPEARQPGLLLARHAVRAVIMG